MNLQKSEIFQINSKLVEKLQIHIYSKDRSKDINHYLAFSTLVY